MTTNVLNARRELCDAMHVSMMISWSLRTERAMRLDRAWDAYDAALLASQSPASAPEQASVGAEALAKRFHETYERLAPSFGYETRRESAGPWEKVPENVRGLMIAACAEVLAALSPRPSDVREQQDKSWQCPKCKRWQMHAWNICRSEFDTGIPCDGVREQQAEQAMCCKQELPASDSPKRFHGESWACRRCGREWKFRPGWRWKNSLPAGADYERHEAGSNLEPSSKTRSSGPVGEAGSSSNQQQAEQGDGGVNEYGVRAIAAEIGLSPGMISRWLRRRTGMGQNNVKHLLRAVNKAKASP
jgi:hypothetical protein